MAMKGFLSYHSYLDIMEPLSDAECGRLYRACLVYSATGIVPELNGNERFLFYSMKHQIDEDAAKYEEKCERLKANASKSRRNASKSGSKICKSGANENEKEKENINNPPTPLTGVYAKRFDEFWAAYPQKVGKGAARSAFAKIKASQELTDRRIEAVNKAKASQQWQKEGGRFIPNPSTWLNQGRWEDELEVEPPKPKEAPYPHPPKMTEEEKREARELAKYGRQNPLLDEFERRLRCKSVERAGN